MQLRDYQSIMHDLIVNSHHRHILAVAPCGAGKTVIMSTITRTLDVPTLIIAHRQELVSQMSLTLARSGIYHDIIAPDKVIRFIVALHCHEINDVYYKAGSKVVVASVDTLIRRDCSSWANKIELWQIDEGHHVLPDNKWGKVVEQFHNATGVGWTATPVRSDKKPLGSIYNDIIIGPTMRELITRNYLSDYSIKGPEVHMDRTNLKTGSTGDYTKNSLSTETKRANITGDVIEQYKKHASGKRGVTFAASVELAKEYAQAYRDSHIPAAYVDAHTSDKDRIDAVRGLKNGTLLQLTNVDIFGEGFDLPAIECVSMARATMSYGLYVQMFGRGLRIAPNKSHGIIIDHVGNVMEHGLPDYKFDWTLDYDKPEIEIPIRQCMNFECLAIFEGFTKTCPYCGWKPERNADRKHATHPEQVEGNLVEYSEELINQLQGEADKLLQEPFYGMSVFAQQNTRKRKDAQLNLRDKISKWAGYYKDIHGSTDEEIYLRFYHTYGIDILTAQTLRPKAANELNERIIL